MVEDRYTVSAEFAYIGRTFTEYCAMFDLDPAALTGRRVLDCGGGASAFTAVGDAVGLETVAVDPVYVRSPDELEDVCEDALERALTQLAEKRDLFVWDYYGDVRTRGRYLRSAAERFLADFGRRPGRYVAGALPDLPLPTDAVSLALSANVLFLYDDRLSETFHREALRELARVAAEEVRVFPVTSLASRRSPFVEPMVRTLRDEGLSVALETVPYEFQRGSTEMLVVSDVGGYEGRQADQSEPT